jgi:penicillin-binding protein 1C
LRYVARTALGSAIALLAFALWARLGPLPAGLLADSRPSTVVVDRHGERLYEARSAFGTRGDALQANALPATLVAATLAAEDVRFQSHVGVDPIAIVRAMARNIVAWRAAEGGSTITQQVAKMLLARQRPAGSTRGWGTKFWEAIVALRLEHRLSKNAILALYLNLAPYSNQIEGAERAARAYFGRSAAALTPAEAAFLAALPQQPSRYNPWKDAARSRARQTRILTTMGERGWLTAADLGVARREKIALSHEPATLVAPHFVGRVLTETAGDGPRRVETTLDATLQRTVQGIIDARRDVLTAHHAANVAVVVLDNHSSEWLAWEGSGDYFDKAHGGTIDGVVARRQPGSALKPFTYAAAFERGFTPASVLADVPSRFPTAQPGVLYSPRNYDGQFRGPLLARTALAGSENVPAVALASDVGVPAIARLMRRAGFSTLGNNASYYGLGLTLGDAEVRLDELVAAYAMLARGGDFVRPRSVRAIDGRATQADAAETLVSRRTAFWITDILTDAEARAYVFGRGGSLEFPFPVAAKTGTSTAYHDNWAIGYTADVTVGVWVGNFDRTPMHNSSGVTGAGPIFHDVMLAAVERVRGSLPIGDQTPIVAPTADVHQVTLCAISGLAPTDACPTRVTEWVTSDAAVATCTWHHASDRGLVTAWPAEYRDWARAAGATGAAGAEAAPVASAFAPSASADKPVELKIVDPLAGATFLLDPTLRAEFQQLPLRARGGASGSRQWFVDGALVGAATEDQTLRWPLVRGTHQIVVRDDAGRSASTRIVVK